MEISLTTASLVPELTLLLAPVGIKVHAYYLTPEMKLHDRLVNAHLKLLYLLWGGETTNEWTCIVKMYQVYENVLLWS